MHGHSDRTADIAIGAADKEWKQMARLALKIRSGNCNPTWADQQITKFTGIFKRLLDDPIELVQREARR